MTRSTEYPVSPVFLDRWSPRAFDGKPMPTADLMTILEAASWAPSAYNFQPWRFLYALRGDEHWQTMLATLIPFNREWAANASALVVFLSETTMGDPEKPSHSHSFDTGAAWGHFALQATMLGYYTHGMVGIDFEEAARLLAVPSGFRIEAAAVVGRIGDPATLPEKLREREVPSTRKPLEATAFHGPFPAGEA